MTILVCGGRGFNDYELLSGVLIEQYVAHGDLLIVHGGAKGADALAHRFAKENNIPVKVYHANWTKYGRAAGHIRNREMLGAGPGLVIAFPGGRGTADMVRIADQAGVPVLEVMSSAAIALGHEGPDR